MNACRECHGLGGRDVRGGPGRCDRCGREGPEPGAPHLVARHLAPRPGVVEEVEITRQVPSDLPDGPDGRPRGLAVYLVEAERSARAAAGFASLARRWTAAACALAFLSGFLARGAVDFWWRALS